jgi:uncharacterized protein (TIGR02646 family)
MMPMRELHRIDLEARQTKYLRKKQNEVDAAAGAGIKNIWKRARETQVVRGIAGVLRQISGDRERCMFCQDSRGVAIEHFWPKRRYYRRAFRWTNFLLVCDNCNRLKGERFDFHHGRPKLINPLDEDPWDFLFYEPLTGRLAAAVDSDTGVPSVKGLHTIDPDLLRLNDDVIVRGRQNTYRRPRRSVKHCLDRLAAGAPAASEADELRQAVHDDDDCALAQWYFRKRGAADPLQQVGVQVEITHRDQIDDHD